MWPLYAGGFLGPFGGAMVTPMLPELRDGLNTTLAGAAWSLTAYLIPFASIMIVSGTLAERWGRRRTVKLAYLAYAAASLGCALAPTVGLFLTGRSLQGAANAFTTPLLVASISNLVPQQRLGRSLGHYSSMQAAGQAFAPLVGGAAAALNYRWAFVASMVAAAALALVPPPDAPSTPGTPGRTSARDRWRALLNRELTVACAVAFGLYFATSGLLLLVALLAGDRFGLGPDARGLVIAAFGVAGLLGGSALGRLADRTGIGRFAAAALIVLTVAVALAGLSSSIAMLVTLTAACGAASTGGRLVVNTLAVTSTPTNRGGATSIMLAWQFLGSALAPLAFLPIYHTGPELGFLASSSGAGFGLVMLVGAGALRSGPRPGALRPGVAAAAAAAARVAVPKPWDGDPEQANGQQPSRRGDSQAAT
jgi:MFS family permease